jgi:hypothetical protein
MEKQLLENRFAKVNNDELGFVYQYADTDYVFKHGNFILSPKFEYCVESDNKIIPISEPFTDFEDIKMLFYLLTKREDIEELYSLIDKHGNG